MRTKSIAAAALVAVPLFTLPAAPALAAGQPAYHPGQRPTALPLLAGATGGAVIGGNGDHLLLGFVTRPDGTDVPTEWTGGPANWAVTDLSSGGQFDGNAVSIDRRGDILINNESGSGQAWVRTTDGVGHPLPAPAGSGAVGIQMNDRGEISGAVIGPAPDYHYTGAVWPDYHSLPRLKNPLPFPGGADSTLLGMNNFGVTVGNSCDANCNNDVGGVWRPGSPDGQILPGLHGNLHSFPVRINDAGMSVGDVVNDDFTAGDAAVWFGRHLLDVGTAVPSDTFASFHGVSQDGRAVGVSIAADGNSWRVIYWRLGHRIRIMLPLAGDWRTGQAGAHYVSDDGLVGGDSTDASGNDVPVVWPDADAESFLPASSTG